MSIIVKAMKPISFGARSRLIPVALVAALFAPLALASEQLGPVYPISEPDMLNEIHRVLQEKQASGDLAKLQEEAITRSRKSIENPKPVRGLSRVEVAKHFYWDPTIRVPRTVTDPEGRVIVEAGKTVNPLDYVGLSNHLLFFDGADPNQVEMALHVYKHYEGRVKPILTAGSPVELSRRWRMQVYFDQGGSLVRRLGIQRVPSLVSQEGKLLRIDELEL